MGGVRIDYLTGYEIFSDQSRSLPDGGAGGLSAMWSPWRDSIALSNDAM